jgi:hypothetical protein
MDERMVPMSSAPMVLLTGINAGIAKKGKRK